MRKSFRYGIAAGVALIIFIGVVWWNTSRTSDPVYQGKPLVYWLEAFETDDFRGKPKFNDAVEAVRQAGTNAIPILLRLLRTKDSDLRQRFTLLAQKQHLVKVDYHTSDGQHWVARQGFVALGRIGRYAIPQLREIHQAEIAGTWKYNYAGEILDLLEIWDKNAVKHP